MLGGKVTMFDGWPLTAHPNKAVAQVAKKRGDRVNHPPHYGGDTTYEVIKVIEAWGLDSSFCLGNTVKYIARAGKKGDRLEDLKKARWYLDREIQRISSKEE